MNKQLANNVNKILGTNLSWEADESGDLPDGIVACVDSRSDACEYLRELRGDDTICASLSRDDEGRSWLFVAPRQ